MSKLLVIGSTNPGTSTNMLLNEAREQLDLEYIPVNTILLELNEKPKITHDGKDLSKFDYCLPRIDSKRAQHGYHVIRFMDMIQMRKPYSAHTVLVAHNKFMSLEVLKKADVAIPKTYLVGSLETAKEILHDMHYPIIIKIVGGFGGAGVMFFEDVDSALSAVQTLKLLKQELIIEEFISNPGQDIRAFIVNGEVVASMRRIAKKGDVRANAFLGGRCEYFALTDEMKNVALEAAAAINSDILAVDMIESKDGPKAIEVNINPGLKGIQKATGINVAKTIIDFVYDQIKEQ